MSSSTSDASPEQTVTMNAVVQDVYGSADVLRLKQIPRPTPAADELLVRVRAASVGAWDWHEMRGDPYVMRLIGRSLRKPKKAVLGLDMAGEVVAVGADVTGFEPGDAVYGEGRETFAEFALAKEDGLARMPAGLSFAEAAAVPIAGATALIGLRDKAALQPGETVLIVGAAGGVGSFAVQIAKSMGAKVTGVCRAKSAVLVRTLGADDVIDYAKEDFTEGGERYDVIFQIAGSASARACRRALEPTGRLVLCSGDGGGRIFGPIVRIAGALFLSPLIRQKIQVYVAEVAVQNLHTLTEMIESGDVRPVVDVTYPLAEAGAAMKRFDHGHTPGKIVLTT